MVTFVDFQKAYNSIDRESLINVIREFCLDPKTTNIIQDILMNTSSRGLMNTKVRGEFSKNFIVNTEVRQDDGLSPCTFYLCPGEGDQSMEEI